MASAQDQAADRYTFLNALELEQLEQLLKNDYSGSMSEDDSEEFIDAVIEVMIKKEKEDPSGRAADVDRAWADFQEYYNVPERDGQLLYPDLAAPVSAPSQKTQARHPSRLLRRVSLVAAAILIVLITMVGAQANGIDVFGFLARWTEEVFVYNPESEYYPAIRDAYVEHHFPEELAAKWYPKGFVASEPKVTETEFSVNIYTLFENEAEGKSFSILIQRYLSSESLLELAHQRDTDSQRQHTKGDKTFFIVSNEGYTTATWSDQKKYVMTISGDLSLKETEKIIDSMGG